MEETTNNEINESEKIADKIKEFEINKLVVDVHNRIAKWHNDEPTNMALKFLSLELVEEIAGAVFKHLGLTYDKGFAMDEETKKKFKSEKEKLTIKSIDDMSEEELLEELQKRKKDF